MTKGVAFNTLYKKWSGFATEFDDLNRIAKNLLEEGEIIKTQEPAVKVT